MSAEGTGIESVSPDTGKSMVFLAILGTQAMGDYIMFHLVAASIARAVPGSKLVVVFRDDRPYKAFFNSLNPHVTTTLKANADPNFVIPLDWFDGETDVSGRPFGEEWYEQGFHKPDILLTPSMLDIGKCLWPAPQFRVPSDIVPTLTEALIRRGVDKDRWFASLHMREAGYKWRPGSDPLRNVNPETYLPMIADIIQKQGGQVVRLGDPAMTPLPEMDGLIDLSWDEDSFPEQAFAISRARYFIGTDSGPTQLAGAFKTPTASTNALGLGLWNDGDTVLFKKYIGPGGNPIERRHLIEILPMLGNSRPLETIFIDNTPKELRDVAARMYGATTDCPGWREDREDGGTYDQPGTVILPIEWKNQANIVNLTF